MLQYKVIEIISPKELLVSYGYENGAQKGDRLRILEKGDPIIIDNKNYGTYDAVKDEVTIHIAYEKFSLCKSATVINFAPLTGLLVASTSSHSLNVDTSSLSNRKLPAITPIKVGDPVEVLPKINR